MNVTVEERDAKAVYFSMDDYDDAKLLAEAVKFLEHLKRDGNIWLLLGMNHQSDEFGDHPPGQYEVRHHGAARRMRGLDQHGKVVVHSQKGVQYVLHPRLSYPGSQITSTPVILVNEPTATATKEPEIRYL